MRLDEWKTILISELKAAGFEVGEYQGLPLVQMPTTFEETCRLLELRTSVACDRSIYEEGMIFLPVGSHALLEKLREEKVAK